MHGVSQPSNRYERSFLDYFSGRISKDDMQREDKAELSRPLEINVLERFHKGYMKLLECYGQLMQTVIRAATDQRHDIPADEWTKRVDKYARRMKCKFKLFHPQIERVFLFLRDLQADTVGCPVVLGELTADSAHGLASIAIDRAVKLWQSCKKTSHRSKTDPRYIYAEEPWKLFFDGCLSGLPKANDLSPLLSLEYAKVKKALVDAFPTPKENINKVEVLAAQTTPKKPHIDREEANVRAREALKDPALRSVRALAKAIGCSEGRICRLPAWQAYQEQLKKQGKKEYPSPKAVSLTDGVLANEGRDDSELQRLMDEQAEDDKAGQRQYRRRKRA
jgi:hypothetical protein